MTHIQTSLLDERYGRSKHSRTDQRVAWGIGGALIVAAVLFALYSGWHAGRDLEYRDLSYSVVDARTVIVEAQVTAPHDAALVCAVEALSESYATVGWKLVDIDSSGDRSRRFTATVVTTAPATTGTVRECWMDG